MSKKTKVWKGYKRVLDSQNFVRRPVRHKNLRSHYHLAVLEIPAGN